MTRVVEPEVLDSLPAENPEAARSRADLRRVNTWMGHRRILGRALEAARPTGVRHIIELGAGDGTFVRALAKTLHQRWPKVEITLLDQQRLVTPETEEDFRRLGWEPHIVRTDVFDWLASGRQSADLIFANLFLHHFDEPRLRHLFREVAARCACFAAVEPRRHAVARMGCELLWLIGCNRVTRHDARRSVRSGFDGAELSPLWPDGRGWELREKPAGIFSHLFFATRTGQ